MKGADAPATRPTEGSKKGVMAHGKGPDVRERRRGRPPGSKNKPKGLVPADLAANVLTVMKDKVSPEHYEYLRGVIQRGESISTMKELDVLITLVRASAMPYLALEAMPQPMKDADGAPILDDDGQPVMEFRGLNRDATDRLKLLNSLLSLKDNIEKRQDAGAEDDGTPVIVKVFAKRGIDQERLRVLVGVESGVVAGDADGTGWGALPPRTVSGQVVE
jgi:hypothetical protein